MQLVQGQDYIFTVQGTYNGPAGVCDGCVLVTKRYILSAPTREFHQTGDEGYRVHDMPVASYVEQRLNAASMPAQSADELAVALWPELHGAVLFDLTRYQRIKIRSGMLSRGIYLNLKPKGFGGWESVGVKRAEEAKAIDRFYEGLPNRV